jgi:HSP20 family protein
MRTPTRTRNQNLRTLQREIDRVFDTFFPSSNGGSEDSASAQQTWAPRTDLVEGEDAYRLHLDLPGMSREGLTINFEENTLTVSGERRPAETHEGDNVVRVERPHGHFFRSFSLPRTVNPDAIEAAYENGVLTIRVPKAEKHRPRSIEIQ